MKTFRRRFVSCERVASVSAALMSAGLFGLLALINHTAGKVEAQESPVEPILVPPPRPDAPWVEKPKPPERPKESVALPELPEAVLSEKPQPMVVKFDAPVVETGDAGSFLPNAVWVPVATYEVGDLEERPEALRRVAPDYPYEKKMRKIDGWARVVFVVDELGWVRDPEIEAASDREFGEAALDAIRNWRFNPGRREGKAVRTRIRQPFTFSAGD